jgi:Ca-activated chloride channel homolog
MLKTLLRCAATLILTTAIAAQTSPQSPQVPEPKPAPAAPAQGRSKYDDQTYRVTVDLVNIFCSVWDKNTNSFVTNLSKDDFSITEDSQKQEIRNFSREMNVPLTLAFLIDTSQSVAPKLKFEQDAATSFFHSVLRDNDRAMLLEFDSGVTLVQDFTSDPNKMAKQIKTLRAAGGTAMYDAIYLACDEKLIRETGRKAIVIVSDGEDRSSKTSLEQALEMALKAEATIFSISVNRGGFFGVGSTKDGDRIMKQFSDETGGRSFFPFKVDELEDAFKQINQELRSQYNIGYLSSNVKRDGTYRKIEVKIRDKNLKLSYRKGYYAPTS